MFLGFFLDFFKKLWVSVIIFFYFSNSLRQDVPMIRKFGVKLTNTKDNLLKDKRKQKQKQNKLAFSGRRTLVFLRVLVSFLCQNFSDQKFSCNRRTHKPSSDLWFVPGKEVVPKQGHLLHSDAVPGCHLWCWCGQGVPTYPVSATGWWGKRCEPWLHQGGWPWC